MGRIVSDVVGQDKWIVQATNKFHFEVVSRALSIEGLSFFSRTLLCITKVNGAGNPCKAD